MPKARLQIELDSPQDYFEILKGGREFKHNKVSFKVSGSSLSVEIDAEDSRSLTAAIGGVIKQITIIEEASQAISEK